MGIIAVSDVHLGYDESNKKDFKNFLNMVSEKEDIDKFVICGDLLDMWRRDIAGVIIENMDILQQLQKLSEGEFKKEIHYIVGNHDYHLKKLKNSDCPFTFYEEDIHSVIRRDYLKPLALQDGGKTYCFTHGYEFEPIMWASRGAFDALCYSTDRSGDIESRTYKLLERVGVSIEQFLLPTRKRIKIEEVDESIQRARDKIMNKGEILVYGHTHKPFINKKENLVNLGSWVREEKDYNTYLEIKNGTMTLNKFISKEEIETIG